MSMRYAIDVFQGADKLRNWPDFLKPVVTRMVTRVAERQDVARKHLLPYIQERLNLSGGSEKQSDSLQWCIETAPNGQERDPERLMYRLLHLNVAAVHTTSVTFLNALYDLALHQDIHGELRAELAKVLQEDGWSAKGLNNMWKLDSFMVESQRLAPIASCELFLKLGANKVLTRFWQRK
jgi:cytochrome P450